MRTSLGVLLGWGLHSVALLVSPLIASSLGESMASLHVLNWIGLSLSIMHAPTMWSYLRSDSGYLLTEDQQRVLDLIRMAETRGAPKSEIRLLYRRLTQSALEAIDKEPQMSGDSGKGSTEIAREE